MVQSVPGPSWHDAVEQTGSARGEHLRVIAEQTVFILLANLAASIVVMFGTWGLVPESWLVGWCAALWVLSLSRWFASRRFPEGPLDERTLARWERRVVFSALASGCLWGGAGLFFFVPGDAAHNLLLAIVIVGMAAAAAMVLSYQRLAYPAFFVPAVTPVALLLVFEPDASEKAIGLVTPFYFTLMYLLSRSLYRTAHESIVAKLRCEYISYLDALTGIANRRAFEEALTREWQRAQRYQRPLSLLITDIDDFKHFNDLFGHAVGDEVIRSVARTIDGHTRRSADLVARIGGEEFGLILPETDAAGARSMSDLILRDCRRLRSDSGSHSDPVTVSIGVSTCVPSETGTPGDLFRLADHALLAAKRTGKDRVIEAGSLPA